jgi:hypothetical protein
VARRDEYIKRLEEAKPNACSPDKSQPNGGRPRSPETALPADYLTPPKHFIDKTPEQLLRLYDGLTMLQAEKLIEPFKRMWIKTDARVVLLVLDNKGSVATSLRSGSRNIDCRFGAKWKTSLSRYDSGETIKIIGWIGPDQNGQQLYLRDCEIR